MHISHPNQSNPLRYCLPLNLIFLFIVAPVARAAADAAQSHAPHSTLPMPMYETKYYKVYTDVDPQEAKEACIRITKMVEEYHSRTSDFAGQITAKLPFYLFKSADEYYAAGGYPNSAGVFDGARLMAIGDMRSGRQVWHAMQHEGFHQFAHAVIGGAIPIWVNEGMAEYFGEGIFTGDGYVTGVIPSGRLERVRKTIALPVLNGGYKSLRVMMKFSHAMWNQELSVKNYDQAWSMVQFLAHGDSGKYQQAFGRYMGMIGNGRDPQSAWSANFGNDPLAFEARWRAYWQSLSPSPTSDLYAEASVATLTSFLARAFDQKQNFDSFDAFAKSAADGALRTAPDEWLPPSILESTLRDLEVRRQNGEEFTLTPPVGGHLPQLTCNTPEGLRLVGAFTLSNGRVDKVAVSITGKR